MSRRLPPGREVGDLRKNKSACASNKGTIAGEGGHSERKTRSSARTAKRGVESGSTDLCDSAEQKGQKRQRTATARHNPATVENERKKTGGGSNKDNKAKQPKQKSTAASSVDVAIKVHKSSLSQKCVFVCAHGAGGKSDSPGMARYIEMLLEHGDVITFDYPGVRLDNYTPLHLSAAKQASDLYPNTPLFLAGNSMGCRGTVNVVNALAKEEKLLSQLPALAGLIFFSYPLIKLPHPPLSESQRRDREPPLRELPGTVRCLFIAGTRDSFLDKDVNTLKKLVDQLAAQGEVHVVEGGDHGLKGKGQAELDTGIRDAIRTFVS